MASHSPVSSDVTALIADVIADHYPELAEVEVTINALFAFPSKPGQHALKLHGYPCYAVIKINSEKDRIEGKCDATMTIDAVSWKTFAEDRKLATIDHEIRHLLVQRDKQGNPKSDDAGRPKLKMKLHDYQFGGFDEIAERHGKASIEVMTMRMIVDTRRQLFWSWGDDQAPPDDMPTPRLSVATAG